MNRLLTLLLLSGLAGCAHAESSRPPLADTGGAVVPVHEMAGAVGAGSRHQSVRGTVKPMLAAEAWLTVRVKSVKAATEELRKLVASVGGQIVGEHLGAGGAETHARFRLRVPASALQRTMDGVAGLGKLLSRDLTAHDVSRKYFDEGVEKKNLEAEIARLEAIMASAKDTKDVLEVEKELARVRGQLNRVEGDRHFLADRVARAILQVVLSPVPVAPVLGPEAKFHPGLRFVNFFEMPGGPARSTFGGGLSLHLARAFSIDVDLFKDPAHPLTEGIHGYLLSLGGETYSDFLGGGRRAFLNPYLGWRLGFVHEGHRNAAAPGVTVGVELFRNTFVLVGIEARVYGFIGSLNGLAIDSALQVNIAY